MVPAKTNEDRTTRLYCWSILAPTLSCCNQSKYFTLWTIHWTDPITFIRRTAYHTSHTFVTMYCTFFTAVFLFHCDYCCMHSLLHHTQRILFEILLNQTEIRLYLPFFDWYGTKRTLSVWLQIKWKMILIFGLI